MYEFTQVFSLREFHDNLEVFVPEIDAVHDADDVWTVIAYGAHGFEQCGLLEGVMV